jgi:gliding motility-associated lipoprotein GldH
MIQNQKKMRTKLLPAIFVLLFIVACAPNDVYMQYQTVHAEGWSKDSLYTFDVPISDSLARYNVYINIRNRGEYPYQNLWLFLKKISPDSVITNDSIECYLADQRGKWLGTGAGSLMEMPVLYQQNVRFETNGTYQYQIVQGMRDDLLIGINDIGLRIEKVGSK